MRVALASAALALASFAALATAQPSASLKDAYRDAFRIGVAIDAETALGTDSATQRLVLREVNSITADNFLKAALVNPQPGVYDFRAGDAFVALGERHRMFIVGHTLGWHNQTPPWFFTDSAGRPNTQAGGAVGGGRPHGARGGGADRGGHAAGG